MRLLCEDGGYRGKLTQLMWRDKRRSRAPLSPSTLPVASYHESDRLRCFGFNGGVDNILHFLAKAMLLNVLLNGHVFFYRGTGHSETSPLAMRIDQPGTQVLAVCREHIK